MNDRLSLIIPIETSKRELLAKVYTSYLFACHDNISYVGDKTNIYQLHHYINNAIFLDKGYHIGNSELIYKNLADTNTRIVSIDEENGVDHENFSTLDNRFPEKIFDIFDLIFLWGKEQKNFLKNNRAKFNQDKIFSYGNTRFELLKGENHFLYEKKVIEIKQKYNKFILINTSFSFANNHLPRNLVVKNYSSRIPNFHEKVKYQELQINNFLDLAIQLSSLDEFNIVIRPHPEESLSIYEEALSKFSNIYINNSGNVIPWIIASEVMIHHDCTTSIEAAMLGKSSIAFTKDLKKNLTPHLPLSISYNYNNIEDVYNNIAEKKYKEKNINKDLLEDYFSFSCNTTELIVSKIINDIKFSKEPENDIPLKFKILTNIKDLLRTILPKKNKLFYRKIEGLNKKEIGEILNTLNKKYDTNISFTRINKYLFKIYKVKWTPSQGQFIL
jgi:surface carbohydrate biosynthesis protein